MLSRKSNVVIRIKNRSKFTVVVVDLKQIVLPKGSFAVGKYLIGNINHEHSAIWRVNKKVYSHRFSIMSNAEDSPSDDNELRDSK
jgi:hypothetical protein